MQIGPYRFSNPLILAPMAGVTDHPYRRLCRRYGAALAVSEMVSVNPALRHNPKTLRRTDHSGEPGPHSVQILGNDPVHMAEAARINADRGADIIDINMGCPAKKVCNQAAGSALLRDEVLVGRILEAVVKAVDVPVTLKIRTGWSPERRNAVTVAAIAEKSGIRALTVHGRTRACGFSGRAEHLTTRAVKQAVGIPVIANGDIDSPARAREVLALTGADGLMIGRAALGRPWLFREIAAFLDGRGMPSPTRTEILETLLEHLNALYAFYGEPRGIRIARKHIGWYLEQLPGSADFRRRINAEETTAGQLALIRSFFAAAPQESAA